MTVTTHWRYAERLQARYPALRVNPDALYVDEGQIVTSAGSAAGLDMLLHLVRRDHGGAIANRVAQRLVLPPHRDGGQAQFVPRPVAPGGSDRLAKLIDWMRAHAAEPHTLASLAAQAAMSTRTLQRQFADATGMSPLMWLIRERVNLAKDMLETHPALSLAQIAARSGFGSEESLRRHFRRVAATSPAAYRRGMDRGDRAPGLERGAPCRSGARPQHHDARRVLHILEKRRIDDLHVGLLRRRVAQHRPVACRDEEADVRDVEAVRLRVDADVIAGPKPADDIVVDEFARDMSDVPPDDRQSRHVRAAVGFPVELLRDRDGAGAERGCHVIGQHHRPVGPVREEMAAVLEVDVAVHVARPDETIGVVDFVAAFLAAST